jgi:hypothetical protein
MAEMPHTAHRQPAEHGGGMLSKLLAWLLVVVSVVVLGWFASKAFGTLTASASVKGKQYQAVFLTNGQVYFGKLSQLNSGYVKLTNIYYLQVQQTVQPKDQSSSSNNQQVSLAKLGGELHGPEDVMYVNRDQVLFWENLKDSGKVVTAIKNYQAGGGK